MDVSKLVKAMDFQGNSNNSEYIRRYSLIGDALIMIPEAQGTNNKHDKESSSLNWLLVFIFVCDLFIL